MCGPCTISSRPCVWPDEESQPPRQPESQPIGAGPQILPPPTTNGLSGLVNQVTESTASSVSPGVASHSTASLIQQPLGNSPHVPQQPPVADPGRTVAQQHPSPAGIALQSPMKIGYSPDTVSSELWTADFASTRWLDLLTNDAAQADSGFSLSVAPSPTPGDEGERGNGAGTKTPTPAAVQSAPALPINSHIRPPDNPTASDLERKTWQADVDVTLTNHEAGLLRHFADRCARWLDLFDSQKLFSTYAVRLALRNPGLMKAILALAAKHRSRSQGMTLGYDASGSVIQNVAQSSEDSEGVRYYYETLHYVQEALAYNSYTHSEELLATAIVISAYEMLDESDGSGNWQRHLKGVFWIQRSQDVNGGSGGIRQAVWWAWLRQDIWAAFREKRACLSFWKPVKDLRELDQHGLADRAIYLLSQAVNYCAESRRAEATSTIDPSASIKRKIARDELVTKMERWKSFLGKEYKPLPTPSSPTDVFTPLWVHPPHFGVALQAYSFAQILITLHSPNLAGFNGYLKMQRTLAEAVETICGIAMELKEEGCQIISAQCLFGAGLCVQDPSKREVIMTLMQACEARVGWAPMATWRDDLRLEWAKADSESTEPC